MWDNVRSRIHNAPAISRTWAISILFIVAGCNATRNVCLFRMATNAGVAATTVNTAVSGVAIAAR